MIARGVPDSSQSCVQQIDCKNTRGTMRYAIFTESDVRELEKKVNHYLDLGWELRGDMLIDQKFGRYIQVMVKKA